MPSQPRFRRDAADSKGVTVDSTPSQFPDSGSTHVRTLFLSDFHLGTKNAQAGELVAFLRSIEADTIYLIGDIVDFWRIRRRAHWPQSHNDVIQALLKKARRGARLVFIPGNHDDALRAYCGQSFGAVELKLSDVHETADGRRYLIMHGDEFDIVVRYARWLAYLGDTAYGLALWVNTRFNWLRRRSGLGYWSLSAYLKRKVKQAVSFIGEFEAALASEARRHGADGVICGHIHHASTKEIDGVHYINSGDWVESCTAVVEHADGALQILRWFDMAERVPSERGLRRVMRRAA